jgi:hypothetical protein
VAALSSRSQGNPLYRTPLSLQSTTHPGTH